MTTHKKTMRARDLLKVAERDPRAHVRNGKGDHILVSIGDTVCIIRGGIGSRPVDRRVLSKLRNAGLDV